MAIWLHSGYHTYIYIYGGLLGLLRASREGDWLLHLSSIRAMIPWTFAYDKLNYARYMPVYYAQMTQLVSNHPAVYNHFQAVGFAIQLGSNNPFGKLPADQVIEETVNKDTQTPGGTKGFSLKHSAVSRYCMTAEYRSESLRQLRNMVRLPNSTFTHTDLHTTRIRKDLTDVQALMAIMEDEWINPMSGDHPDLVSISTGRLAPKNIAEDLQNAHEKSEKAYQDFKKNRIDTNAPTKKFHDTLSKQGLKTFSDLKKKKQLTQSVGKAVILQSDRNLFAHMLLATQSRKLDIEDVLSHPLGPIPWALASPGGCLRKTNKAALAKALVQDTSLAEAIQTSSACIIRRAP